MGERLVEVEGKKTTAQLALAPELVPANAGVQEVDALERPVADSRAQLEDGVLAVEVPPNGIAAVRVG